MDYDLLLEGCCEAGLQMLRRGAEIYRAEETVRRMLAAYHLQGEVFAIPNCLIVSVRDPEGHAHTRMRRVPMSSVDVEGIERFNSLSRQLCAHPPEDPGEILRLCQEAERDIRPYPLHFILLGYFIGAFFFTLFFSGGIPDAITGGIAGLLAGLTQWLLGRFHTNFFITTAASAAVMTIAACLPVAMGLPVVIDPAIAGAIMVLVPGLVFTNFMSNLLTGDVISGISTFIRAVLTAVAIALGTGAAVTFCRWIWVIPSGGPTTDYAPIFYVLFSFLACVGFCPSFNVRTYGAIFCCLGGGLGWMAYLAANASLQNVFIASYLAAIAVDIWSEAMARLRKCPATSYLVISMLPLVPGLTIYQAMDNCIRGETQLFLDCFFRTFGISGCLAIGLLTVKTIVAVLHHFRVRRAARHAPKV